MEEVAEAFSAVMFMMSVVTMVTVRTVMAMRAMMPERWRRKTKEWMRTRELKRMLLSR